MPPRLTNRGRKHEVKWGERGRFIAPITQSRFASRPSPAERLRQRRKARSDALRYVDKMQGRIVTRLHRMYVAGTLSMGELPRVAISCEHCHIMARIRRGDVSAFASGIECYPECTCNHGIGKLPQSRGTTTSQLVAMHLEAESEP